MWTASSSDGYRSRHIDQVCSYARNTWTPKTGWWEALRGEALDVATGHLPGTFGAADQPLGTVEGSHELVLVGLLEIPLRGRVTPRHRRFVGPLKELLRQWYAAYVRCRGDWSREPPEDEVMVSDSSCRTPRTTADPSGQSPCSSPRSSRLRSSSSTGDTQGGFLRSSCSRRRGARAWRYLRFLVERFSTLPPELSGSSRPISKKGDGAENAV